MQYNDNDQPPATDNEEDGTPTEKSNNNNDIEQAVNILRESCQKVKSSDDALGLESQFNNNYNDRNSTSSSEDDNFYDNVVDDDNKSKSSSQYFSCSSSIAMAAFGAVKNTCSSILNGSSNVDGRDRY